MVIPIDSFVMQLNLIKWIDLEIPVVAVSSKYILVY